MIDLNMTLFIQLINFFIALFVINTFLIRPIRGIMQKRRTMCQDLSRNADDLIRQAASRQEEYDAALKTARVEGERLRAQAREEALARQADCLKNAKNEASAIIASERSTIASEADAAEQKLSNNVQQIAEMVVSRLLAH